MKRVSKLTISLMAILCISSLALPAQARDYFASSTVQATIQNNFAVRQQQLRSQIAQEVGMGTLNPISANQLTSQLDQINMQEQQDLAAAGMISSAQNNFIIGAFTNVTQQLDACTAAACPVPVAVAPVYNVVTPTYLSPAPIVVAPRPFRRPDLARFQPAARPVERVAHNFEARPAFNGQHARAQESHHRG